MEGFKQGKEVLEGLVSGKVRRIVSYRIACCLLPLQIALDETTLDAAKSSIVYGVTKGVSTPGRAVCLDEHFLDGFRLT